MSSSFKHQDHCRICQSQDLICYLDLGEMPLANRNLPASELHLKEPVFPLQLMFCKNCGLSQLSLVIAPEVLYQDYAYYSSVSKTFADHCQSMVASLKEQLILQPKSLVVEIASNDGCLLSKFTEAGFLGVGVEPATNLAITAESKGLAIFNGFWGSNVAEKIQEKYGKADLIIGTNVLAHVDDLNSFLSTAHSLLKSDGHFVVEVPYMADFIDHAEFDTTYHEHLSYFLLSPLKQILEKNNFQIKNVERFTIHGGTIRVICSKSEAAVKLSPNVFHLLKYEKNSGLLSPEIYFTFAKRVQTIKKNLCELISKLKQQNKRIAAYGASAKGNVLLNFCGINPTQIDFIVDDTPAKQGRYQSGTHIPIVEKSQMQASKPDYLLLLAWNFAQEIINKNEEYLKSGGEFIIPLPEIKIINALASHKVAAILPAYESAATVTDVLNRLPRQYFEHIILVDDHSKDNTFEIASLNKSIDVYRNDKNLGYGGNLKVCIELALKKGAEIIIEIHPDGEYGLEAIGPAIQKMREGASLVLGNRFVIAGGPLKNGMYIWKYPFVKILNWVGNVSLGTHLGDLHQGFRVYSSSLFKTIDYKSNSNDYIFSFEIIAQAIFHQFKVQEVPISCHYQGKKRGARLKAVIAYFIEVFVVVLQFWAAKIGIASRLFQKIPH